MHEYEAILATFPHREERLKEITRYSMFTVMLYRPNLWNHARHVSWLTREMEPHATAVFGGAYNSDKAFAIALVHDDAEMITGDIQAGNKSKMSQAELARIDQQEQEAIDELASRSPKNVGPFLYRDLLQEALDRTSLEAQVGMFADKLDAFGETLHEIYAGNPYFVREIVNEYGVIPTPYEVPADSAAHGASRMVFHTAKSVGL
jgi:5'-deoxynucleotidase YfbR-like HD superfamily hydrolase